VDHLLAPATVVVIEAVDLLKSFKSGISGGFVKDEAIK